MNKLWRLLKSSAGELKHVSTISATGMLVALDIVFSLFRITLSPTLEISFAYLPLAIGGMLYGPVVGGVIGALADVLGYFLRPNGPFFPGFTLNALLSGAIYGFFLYRRPATLKRTAVVTAVITVVINLALNTLWLSIMYGKAFIVLLAARVVKNLVMYPIDTALLLVMLKALERIRVRRSAAR